MCAKVEALAFTIQISGAKLDSLTLYGVADGILAFSSGSCDNLISMLRPLRRLHLSINCHSGDTSGSNNAKLDRVGTYLAAESFPNSIEAIGNIRVLELQMPSYLPEAHEAVHPVVDFGHIFGDATAPHLTELSLGWFATSKATLAGLLLRHKCTLQRVSLSNFVLTNNDWPQVFSDIAGKLPKLHKLSPRGEFATALDEYEPADLWLNTGNAYMAACDRWEILLPRIAVERFVFEGGEVPDVHRLYQVGEELRKNPKLPRPERMYEPPEPVIRNDGFDEADENW